MGNGQGSLSRRDSLRRVFDPAKSWLTAARHGDSAAEAESAREEPLSAAERALHLTRRITFGPRRGDLEHVRQIGPEAFLEQQLHPESIDDSDAEPRWSNLPTLSMSTEELLEAYPRPTPKQRQAARARRQARQSGRAMEMPAEAGSRAAPQPPRRIVAELAQEEILRAVYSERQLQEVMVQFWMNHFNIYAFKGPERWMLTSFELDTIRPRTLGNFEDLLVATAQSPAMLFYLDNWMSSSAKVYFPRRFGRRRHFGGGSGRRRFLARERHDGKHAGKKMRRGINENYGRELMELHTLGVNGGYTQKDVIEVARCLTGWTIQRPRKGGGFIFRPFLHDYGPKVVLGHKFPAGRGIEDGYQVLHLLAHHPSTAHHLAYELAQRFVSDQPPASVVDRARDKFLSTHGDIRAVLKTILTSPEFYSRAAFGAKVKSPIELAASSLRALDAETDAGRPLLAALARMGEPMFLYQAPSGYPDRADVWINSGSLLARLNFANLLSENRLRGTRVPWERWRLGTGSAQGDGAPLGEELLGEAPSARTRQAIQSRLDSLGAEPRQELAAAAGLWLASPEFQRR